LEKEETHARRVRNLLAERCGSKPARDSHPGEKGNIRDYADVSRLVCLSNLENLNALFIQEKTPPPERLRKLNRIAIQQMKFLTDDSRTKRLEAEEI